VTPIPLCLGLEAVASREKGIEAAVQMIEL